MPHSSGGGSSGGSFGGSSSSRSGSSTSFSNRPFPGSHPYVYYGLRGRPVLIYSAQDPSTYKKISWVVYVIFAFFMMIPIGFMIMDGFHNPTKIPTDTASHLIVDDKREVLSDDEESQIMTLFEGFREETGISPAFQTIHESEYRGKSLEQYAYDEYVKRWPHNETHWLIVYSSDLTSPKGNFLFEGMQGNDTDNILTFNVTMKFNDRFVATLNDSSLTVGEAFIDSFSSIIPGIMESSFYLNFDLIFPICIWVGFAAIFLGFMIWNNVRIGLVKKAVKVTAEKISLTNCPHCGAKYYQGTTSTCPKCGSPLPKVEENEVSFDEKRKTRFEGRGKDDPK